MVLAKNPFGEVWLATRFGTEPIPEIGVATKQLSAENDIHFGMNVRKWDKFLQNRDDWDSDLEDLGPRVLDILNRGGRTAEDTWYSLVRKQQRKRKPSPGFQEYFDEFGKQKIVKPHNDVFPENAYQSAQPIGGSPRYKKSGGTKTIDNMQFGREQHGVRWSKTALEYALAFNGTIHFHLDNMGDLSKIFDKTDLYAYNVTSRELRYVWRNWERFQGRVKFYNGYTAKNQVVEVKPPWEGLPSPWAPDATTSTCTRCKTAFTFFTRKHHCRKCGKIFCNDCANTRIDLYTQGILPARPVGKEFEKGPVRVCKDCKSSLHQL